MPKWFDKLGSGCIDFVGFTHCFAATFRGVALKDVNLSGSLGLTADQVRSAFGDGSVILPEHLRPRPAHWPDWDMDLATFYENYRLWQRDPANYRPPPKPPN